eukprot:365192-Chlamydomonas_euryale.AAC.9
MPACRLQQAPHRPSRSASLTCRTFSIRFRKDANLPWSRSATKSDHTNYPIWPQFSSEACPKRYDGHTTPRCYRVRYRTRTSLTAAKALAHLLSIHFQIQLSAVRHLAADRGRRLISPSCPPANTRVLPLARAAALKRSRDLEALRVEFFVLSVVLRRSPLSYRSCAWCSPPDQQPGSCNTCPAHRRPLPTETQGAIPLCLGQREPGLAGYGGEHASRVSGNRKPGGPCTSPFLAIDCVSSAACAWECMD